MAELITTYSGARELAEDLSLVQDARTGFYINAAGHPIGFHRTSGASSNNIPPATEGLFGAGLYIGNTDNVLSSFSKVSYMRTLLAVELPCEVGEIEVIKNPGLFSREEFDKRNSLNGNQVKLLTWRAPLGNTIGCIAMGGLTKFPRIPRWGLWIDEATPIQPFAKIS